MSKIWVNVEGAIYKDTKWLMILRGKNEAHAAGTLSFVGGTLETEEDTHDALEKTLQREIKEEVGIKVNDEMIYLESKMFTSDKGEKCLDVVFLCTYKSGEPQIMNDEVAGIFWLTAEEIATHSKCPAWIRQSIQLANRVSSENNS